MNLRHSASLALLGWFLMAPPFNHTTLKIDLKAPMSKWENLRGVNSRWEGEFQSREKCERYKTDGMDWFNHQKPEFRDQPGHRAFFEQMRLARCISPDSVAMR